MAAVGYEASRKFAIFGMLASVIVILTSILLIPMLLMKANQARKDTENSSVAYVERSDRIWLQMMRFGKPVSSPVNSFASTLRKGRSMWDVVCQCHSLSCPMGLAGPPGANADDGLQGKHGDPGVAGEDGFDMQLEAEPDMPCILCIAGPPGQRGVQGDRGLSGDVGRRGDPGVDGLNGKQAKF